MYILICNAGSTSLKYKLFLMPGEQAVAEGKMDRVGSRNASIFSYKSTKTSFIREGMDIPSYREGIRLFLDALTDAETGVIAGVADVDAIGFKTVIGKGYTGVHDIDDACMQGLEDYMNVAPVHNSAYLEAIRAFKALLPDMPMVGVFEPFFHRTIPEEAYVYGIPYEWAQAHGIRRYGYHGASHRYVSETAKKYGNPKYVISCHLGGSGSICAIRGGVSQNNSFGFSLQSGVQHSTHQRPRPVHPHLPAEIRPDWKKCGTAVSAAAAFGHLRRLGRSSRHSRKGDKRARLAIDVYCTASARISVAITLSSGLDLLFFTGGIGGIRRCRLVCERFRARGHQAGQPKTPPAAGRSCSSLPLIPA